jgi:hypothetical protein
MRALALCICFAALAACSNSRRDMVRPRDAGATRVDSGRPGDGGGPADTGGSDAGTAGDLEYDAEGCLTFGGASQLCGFSSDGMICSFALECGLSESTSQCGINCEMGTTVMCYTREHVACLRSAASTFNCSAAAECGFIL